MLRNTTNSHVKKYLACIGIFACITFFLICSNTIYLHRRVCVNYSSGSGPYRDISVPISESLTPVQTKSYIFVRDQSLITRLSENSNTSKASIDLLLNIRKLTAFAVRELNKFVTSLPCSEKNCPADGAWWANPLNTLALKTYFPLTFNYVEHDLTFIGEPDGTPFFVRIRQYNVSTATNTFELEIKGKFFRFDGENVTGPKFIPPGFNSSTMTIVTAQGVAEEAADPQLTTWPKNKSFLVGDYVDLKDKGMYKMSPGRMNQTTHAQYCGTALKMLIMVSSAPKHFEQRKVIREGYGSKENLEGKGVRVVFLFGIVTDKGLQTFLEDEAKEHDDLIQANFMDSYHNLSLSHLSMYNWVQTTCEGRGLPKYVLKADDDFFLNVDLALRVAYGNPSFELMGVAYCGTRPVRNIAYMTKYYTPRYMYMPEVYVGYLSGVAYIFRTDIIPRILKISLTTPMIHMDDVYMTGLLARQLNIPPMGSPLFTYGRSELNPCAMKMMVSSYALSVQDMKAQWEEFAKPVPVNCSLAGLNDLIKINPFRPQDMVACILE